MPSRRLTEPKPARTNRNKGRIIGPLQQAGNLRNWAQGFVVNVSIKLLDVLISKYPDDDKLLGAVINAQKAMGRVRLAVDAAWERQKNLIKTQQLIDKQTADDLQGTLSPSEAIRHNGKKLLSDTERDWFNSL